MIATVDAVFEEAMTLAEAERMDLVERLIPTIHSDPEIEAAQLREIQRRMDEVRSGEVQTIPGEIVFREVRDSLAARRKA